MLDGREAEVMIVDRLVNAACAGEGGALVIRGAPGIGKSALLNTVRQDDRDVQILHARGVEAEADLPFAGLHQLLHPVWAEIGVLPDGVGGVLGAALGDDAGSGRERFLVYSACLNVLSELASRAPIVCLVDDAHWLDSASAEALQFCARRLAREPIAMLFAVREDDGDGFGRDLPSLGLAALDLDVAAALLRRTTDISDAVAARILDQARGNPLAIVELPRALTDAQLAGAAPLPDQLPLSAQLEASYAARINRLSEEGQRVLLVAALDDSEDLRIISRAATALGLDPTLLDDAERAGLIRVSAQRIEFCHPLVRSALHGSVPSGDRRGVHQAIADVLADDPREADRRAWHLADAGLAEADVIVGELERAAHRAQRRGGFRAAARALERAADLATDPATSARLRVRAAHHFSRSGDDGQALALTADVDTRLLEVAEQAALAFVRASASIRSHGRPADARVGLTDVAERLSAQHPRLAARLLPAAMFAAWQAWDREGQLDVARICASIDVDRLGPTEVRLAASIEGFAALIQGDRRSAVERLSGTVRWGRGVGDAHQAIWAAWAALWIGDDGSFGELLRHSIDLARRQGDLGALSEALGMQSVQLALLAQRYDDATIAATEALSLSADLGAESLTLLPLSSQAIVAAIRGDVDSARRHVDDVMRLQRARGHPFRASPALLASALVDMSSGRWTSALDSLRRIGDPGDPTLAIAAPELIEAAARSGELEQASEAFTSCEARVECAPQPTMRSRLEACRALLDPSHADEHFERAMASADDAPPFDRARVDLLYGEHLRRSGRRSAARDRLRAALDRFDAIGAQPWAERAQRELAATGETARRRHAGSVEQLTPQELQISRLVAAGLTNKEVAAQLYLSPRTIDAHLRSVFAKLGITSRRELRANALGDARGA